MPTKSTWYRKQNYDYLIEKAGVEGFSEYINKLIEEDAISSDTSVKREPIIESVPYKKKEKVRKETNLSALFGDKLSAVNKPRCKLCNSFLNLKDQCSQKGCKKFMKVQ